MPDKISYQKDSERVRPEALLMELPEISVEEWTRAAAPYLVEAGQIALLLWQQSNEIEMLLDQADALVDRGDAPGAKSFLADACKGLPAMSSVEGIHAGVKAGLIADRIGDEAFRGKIIPNVSTSLRKVGLTDVATVLEDYDRIAAEVGQETAALIRLGTITRVNTWALGCSQLKDDDR